MRRSKRLKRDSQQGSSGSYPSASDANQVYAESMDVSNEMIDSSDGKRVEHEILFVRFAAWRSIRKSKNWERERME